MKWSGFVFAWLLTARVASAACPPGPFCVQAWFDAKHDETAGKVHIYDVEARVTNTSGRDQDIVVWTQAGWSWVSGSPRLAQPHIEALQNMRRVVRLKPGQAYDSVVGIESTSSRPPYSLRLGFVPEAEAPASGQLDKIRRWGGVFWSPPILPR